MLRCNFFKNSKKLPPHIILVIGHTGAGKSTLSRAIEEKYGYKIIEFSELGREYAVARNDEAKKQLIERCFKNIVEIIKREKTIIVDGLAISIVVQQLIESQYRVKIVYLDTPYLSRLTFIKKRYNCNIGDAEKIEKEKSKGKEKGGINNVILKADYVINGSNSREKIIEDFILWYSMIDKQKDEKQKSKNN